MAQKTYDEYAVGEKFTSYARTMTEADLVNYTNLAGLKLPLFIDVEYCRKHSIFKERVFPGLLTASIAAGMLEDILGKYTLAALGLDKFKFKGRLSGDDPNSKFELLGNVFGNQLSVGLSFSNFNDVQKHFVSG